MSNLPTKFAWLALEPGPKMLVEALRHYGVTEVQGKSNNADIMRWAKEVGVNGWYTDDQIPWCGLFVGVVASRCGYPYSSGKLLSSLQWSDKYKKGEPGYGVKVLQADVQLGDIMIFIRPGGGHIGFYCGENEHNYLVLGGNTSNAVGFAWIAKERFYDARRPAYKSGKPYGNPRKILLEYNGEPVSTNEA